MNLNHTESSIIQEAHQSYQRNGVATLTPFCLPPQFIPQNTDLVFVKTNQGSCETYIGANVTYRGADPYWNQVMSNPEAPGGARLILEPQGGFFEALDSAQEALNRAGASVPFDEETAIMPSDDANTAEAESEEEISPGPEDASPGANSPDDGSGGQAPLTDMNRIRQEISEDDKPIRISKNELTSRIKKKVRGQDRAIDLLVGSICRQYSRKNPSRPAVLFAVGPTGVGKTRTAEVAAEALQEMSGDRRFGYHRLDMSEYQESHRVSQLLGAPQGYAGYGDGSQLINALESNPRTILLIDEIEKAHPDIFRTFMNAMDAGRISKASGDGAQGHQVSCKEAVFIFTSNLECQSILDELDSCDGYGNLRVERDVCARRLLDAGIAPEIIGRIGCFLVFRPLLPETKAEIVSLDIVEIAKEYGVEVSYIAPEVIMKIHRETLNNSFGARPARYLIDELLGDYFIEKANEENPGPCQIELAHLEYAHLETESVGEE